jgi:hypothetical protein|tara:strand:+ start:5014 stop:5970 length:957 start_codon:yes stop_codon:yes gene_type:complete
MSIQLITPEKQCNRFPELNRELITMPIAQSVDILARQSDDPRIREKFLESEVVESDDFSMVMWADTKEVIGVNSSKYRLVHHADVANMAVETVEKLTGYTPEWAYHKIGSKGEGLDSIAIHMDCPGFKPIRVNNSQWLEGDTNYKPEVGDLTSMKFFLRNGLTGGSLIEACARLMRLWCANGAQTPHEIGHYKHKHTKGLDIELLAESFDQMTHNSRKLPAVFNHWNATKLGAAELEKLVDSLEEAKVSKYHLKGFRDAVSRGGYMTKWAAFNKITNRATHHAPSIKNQIAFDRIISKVFWSDDETKELLNSNFAVAA